MKTESKTRVRGPSEERHNQELQLSVSLSTFVCLFVCLDPQCGLTVVLQTWVRRSERAGGGGEEREREAGRGRVSGSGHP